MGILTIKPEGKCNCEGKHKDHICELFRTRQVQQLEYITDDHIYTCLSCCADAYFSDYLCTPVPLLSSGDLNNGRVFTLSELRQY
jgi:hypothetical protein